MIVHQCKPERPLTIDQPESLCLVCHRTVALDDGFRYGPTGVDWSRHQVPSRPYSNTRSYARER